MPTKARQRELTEANAYAAYRRTAAEALYQNLPVGEQTIVDDLAREAAGWRAAGPGSTAEIMLRLTRAGITADRHPENVLTFEQWRGSARAA